MFFVSRGELFCLLYFRLSAFFVLHVLERFSIFSSSLFCWSPFFCSYILPGQSFPYENHCEGYEKIVTRAIYTEPIFVLIYTVSPPTGKQKVVVIAVFLSKLDTSRVY